MTTITLELDELSDDTIMSLCIDTKNKEHLTELKTILGREIYYRMTDKHKLVIVVELERQGNSYKATARNHEVVELTQDLALYQIHTLIYEELGTDDYEYVIAYKEPA